MNSYDQAIESYNYVFQSLGDTLLIQKVNWEESNISCLALLIIRYLKRRIYSLNDTILQKSSKHHMF